LMPILVFAVDVDEEALSTPGALNLKKREWLMKRPLPSARSSHRIPETALANPFSLLPLPPIGLVDKCEPARAQTTDRLHSKVKRVRRRNKILRQLCEEPNDSRNSVLYLLSSRAQLVCSCHTK
jgi:hypothetical protein